MKFYSALVVVFVFLGISSSANAQAPMGVGAAEHWPAECIFTGVLEPDDPEYPTLFDSGYVVVNFYDVDDNKLVVTNSKDNNITLNCTGKINPSETITGLDVLASQAAGELIFVDGKITSFKEGCDFVALLGYDTCSGNGYGASKGGPEVAGVTCNIFWNGEWRITEHWKELTTPSGRKKLYCHWNGKD